MSHMELPIDSIQLDFDNPRIKQFLEMYHDAITSEHIALALCSSSGNGNSYSYQALKESIKVSGGIINPIIVNHIDGKYIVVEGNTRVQIYKEFAALDPTGPWDKIIAIVYENLRNEEIHAIRLQTHLVGPRDWDAFSKAKYLHQLSNIDKLPMSTIISYCGGKGPEIRKLIDAYVDMITHYFPVADEAGIDPNPQEFSKFAELQNRSITESLLIHHYSKKDFASWVVKGNIENAQNVRKLPKILASKEALNVFLKSNISEAEKYINIPKNGEKDLKSATLYELVNELISRIRNIKFAEVNSLKIDPLYEDKKNDLLTLLEETQYLVTEITEE